MVNRRQRHVRTGIVLRKLQALFNRGGSIKAARNETDGRFFSPWLDKALANVAKALFGGLNRLRLDGLQAHAFDPMLLAKSVMGLKCRLAGRLPANGHYRFAQP